MGYSSLSTDLLTKRGRGTGRHARPGTRARFATAQQEYAHNKAAFMRLPKSPRLYIKNRKNPRQGRWTVKCYTDDFNLVTTRHLKSGVSGDDEHVMEVMMYKVANSFGAVIFRWHLNGRISHVSEY